jgi:hypothetical protein
MPLLSWPIKNKAEIIKIKRRIKKILTLLENYKDWTIKQKYDYYGIKKIGYLDIETSGLTADFDIMLTWANLIRDVETGKIKTEMDFVTKNDFELAQKNKDADLIDRRITETVIDSMSDCDLLIGHWFIGKHRHDIPFIRTRAAINKVSGLPHHKQVRYGDTQKWASTLFRLHNNGLDTVADMFNISTKKTRLEPKIWKNACIGIPTAIDYILEHNIKDVRITYKVHKEIENYVPIPATYY